jgi:hypothetical protein
LKFRKILSHQGPLSNNDKDRNGSKYIVMIEWVNGEISLNPLSAIAADDPVPCAIYARDNNLLDVDGWKHLNAISKRQKKFDLIVNQAKLRSYRTALKFQYGFQIPRSFSNAK